MWLLLSCAEPLSQGLQPPVPPPVDPLQARATELRQTVPEGFTVVIEAPWVVAGDEPEQNVRARAAQTVRWATRQLEGSLFPARPAEVWTIWLFRDADSYRQHAVGLLGHPEPHTPYGYASDGQLVMNIATGGGTLIHEMVHPYVAANAPGAPPWINEGLGSLYEQCGERDGRMVGLTNWRLEGLQDAIRADVLPPLQTLIEQDDHAFYREDPGTNYAQARYLMLWLQEHGQLETFWHGWRREQAADPSGLLALRRTLQVEDLAAWQEDWERWALGLRFP
jgi:hypothetical protein